jgi:hypothetical protein
MATQHFLPKGRRCELRHELYSCSSYSDAIATAFANESIKPVEAYIMIMICFGFYFTVLSSLGIRIFFLDPEKLTLFLDEVKETIEPWLINGMK